MQSLSDAASKTVVIPNGINSEIFCPGDRSEARRRLGLSPEGRILLSVGRLHSSKGYPLLVEALGQLSTEARDLRIVIVGESDHEADARPAIEAAAHRLGISEKVKLVGAQPHSVVADWYRAADLFCLPTHREGSANVLLEALACGLPCITTPVGGNPDIISTEEVGILVNPEVKLLARAIAQSLARRWDRERIADHVRKRTWASVASECYENLSRVANFKSGNVAMNILYHHRTLGDGAEGIHVSSIVEAFRALGHDVKLTSLIGEEVAVSTPRVRMLEHVRRRMPRSLYEVMEIGYSVAGYRLLTSQVNGWKPEFLYERYMLFNMAGLMAARRLGIPLVLEVNAPLAYERAQYERLSLKRAAQLFERSLFRSADLVLTVSTPLKDYIVQQGVPSGKCFCAS